MIPTRSRVLWLSLAVLVLSIPLPAATYLPISDTDLAGKAPLIVRARVISQTARVERIDGADVPFTVVTLQRLEALKGIAPDEAFSVRLPGGRVGDIVRLVPGTPVFAGQQEVVLMLAPSEGHPGELRLSEFGLSKFDLVADEAGRRFAVRPAFGPRQDLVVSQRPEADSGDLDERSAVPARDAESFLAALREAGRGARMPEVGYATPTGDFGPKETGLREKWANIGGREPGTCHNPDGTITPCLFRWFWDTGTSPNAVLTVTGTQSNLRNDEPSCGTDFNCDAVNAATKWHGVASTDIRISGPSTTGNVTVALDATQDFNGGSAWTTPLDCSGGIIGLGGPGGGFGPRTFKGDTTYYAPTSGNVSMRKVTCSSGYSAATFRSALLHEVGHVLGLAHPDQHVSLHSTTTSSDWNIAVMHSVVPPAKPDTPQPDDIQAMQFYYGTAAPGPVPAANFSFSPSAPSSGSPVSFSDASTNVPTGWNWDFGDAASGASNTATAQNVSHVFSGPGTFTVTLSAANYSGTGTTAKSVTVAGVATVCVPGTNTLCLNNGRFQVTAAWQKSDGSSGLGTAVSLTGDTGYFWFFGSTNIELITKVLNACANPFNHYWVFSAGLTNVKVTLTVTDTSNGAVKQYVNPLGTAYAPVQDTSAFATCP